MPLYDIHCPICGHEDEVFRAVKDYDDLPECCGAKMERKLSAPQVMPDIQPYRSQATGEWITSRSHHRKHLKANGLIEVGNEKMEPPKPKKSDSLKKELIKQIYGH